MAKQPLSFKNTLWDSPLNIKISVRVDNGT